MIAASALSGANLRRLRTSTAGFSLLETIVVLVLLSLMLALLPGVLDLGRQALRAQRHVDREDQIETADAVIRRLIGSIRPTRRTGPDGRALIAFTGEPQTLAFTAGAPEALAGAGVVNWRLELADPLSARAGVRDLVLVLDPSAGSTSGSETAGEAEARRSRLIADVTTLSVGYFGTAPDQGTSAWQPRWVDRDRLPQLIEIAITVDGREHRVLGSPGR